MKRFALVLALLIVTAGPAVAGIVDTPLPPGTNYLFSVPGVTNAAGLGTYFTCTSTSADPQTVTVEAFDPGGNLSGTASAVVNAGQSARFGTQPAASIGLLANNLGSGVILVGSARILSTAKGKLLCTAVVADATNAIPNSMVYLSIIAKTKQKAAN